MPRVTGRCAGVLLGVEGHRLAARLPGARRGDPVVAGRPPVACAAWVGEAVGERAMLVALDPTDGLAPGDPVAADPGGGLARVGTALLGRAVDGRGRPLAGPVPGGVRRPLGGRAPSPEERVPIEVPFASGLRVLDGPLAFGRGARIGIFGAAGAGKSTLLEQLAGGSAVDATVVALIGERGREAERWLARLGPRATLVCATADRGPAERLRAADLAFAQAEALRERGLHVLLVLDSLARVAAAARDLAVAAGEPLGRGGFPPSVVARQARLLERAGSVGTGSITLVATVLSEGPLSADPVADAARAALDGHVVLCPRRAAAGHFPAVDLGASASRTLADVASAEHRAAAGLLRDAVARIEESRDARAAGLDPAAGDPALARALAAEPAIAEFLRQGPAPAALADTLEELAALGRRLAPNGPQREPPDLKPEAVATDALSVDGSFR